MEASQNLFKKYAQHVENVFKSKYFLWQITIRLFSCSCQSGFGSINTQTICSWLELITELCADYFFHCLSDNIISDLKYIYNIFRVFENIVNMNMINLDEAVRIIQGPKWLRMIYQHETSAGRNKHSSSHRLCDLYGSIHVHFLIVPRLTYWVQS